MSSSIYLLFVSLSFNAPCSLLGSLVKQHLGHVENRLFEMFGDEEKRTININKFLMVGTEMFALGGKINVYTSSGVTFLYKTILSSFFVLIIALL